MLNFVMTFRMLTISNKSVQECDSRDDDSSNAVKMLSQKSFSKHKELSDLNNLKS